MRSVFPSTASESAGLFTLSDILAHWPNDLLYYLGSSMGQAHLLNFFFHLKSLALALEILVDGELGINMKS